MIKKEMIIRIKILLTIVTALFFIAKMILFEPISLGTGTLRFETVAIFIPLALIFGWLGVASLGIACFLAHLVKGLGIIDSTGAGISIFLGSAVAYLFVKKFIDLRLKYFIGVWIQLAIISVGIGITASLVRDVNVYFAIANVFGNIWVGIVVIGYLILELLNIFSKKYRLNLAIWEK